MSAIKAKVRVHNVSSLSHGPDSPKFGEYVRMSPVYSNDPQSENYSFSQATPGGTIELNITNPSAFGFFEENKEYRVDFTPAN